MALQKNLIAQVSYNEGASPNSRGNVGVTNVARTSGAPAGSWDVDLQYGYSPGSDDASLQITGATPGFCTVDEVPGDTGKIRVRTFGAADGLLVDLPWTLTVYRNALLTSTQDL